MTESKLPIAASLLCVSSFIVSLIPLFLIATEPEVTDKEPCRLEVFHGLVPCGMIYRHVKEGPFGFPEQEEWTSLRGL